MAEKVAEAEAAGLEASSIDQDQLFLDVLDELGCMDKGRIYGIGNRASSLSSDGSLGSTTGTPITPSLTQDQIVELVRSIIAESFDKNFDSALDSKFPKLVKTVLIKLGKGSSQTAEPADESVDEEEDISGDDEDDDGDGDDNGDEEDDKVSASASYFRNGTYGLRDNDELLV